VTKQVFKFVKGLKLQGKVLDCGSLDINGSVRDLFIDYTGLDRIPGKNVDVVASCHKIPFPDEYFDHVLSLEMIEHDDDFWKSISEMRRVLKPGGKLVITTRGIYFKLHEDHPGVNDYWRFTGKALKLLFGDMKNIFVTDQTGENGVFGYATK